MVAQLQLLLWNATLRSSFSVSHINETAGSNSKIYVEEVVLAPTVV